MNRIEESLFGNIKKSLEPESSSSSPKDSVASMPVPPSVPKTEESPSTQGLDNVFDIRNLIIFILLIFFILAFLGINVFNILGGSIQTLVDLGGGYFQNVLKAFGYSTGTALNKTSEIAADIAKTGVDIADGAVQNIGDLLISTDDQHNIPAPIPPPQPSTPSIPPTSLEDSIQKSQSSNADMNEPSPDSSENPIQKPITSEKMNWCLIGEYNNKRGCVSITESEKCLSGQVFPSQQMCLNPTMTANPA
jgi:hypothetical protein